MVKIQWYFCNADSGKKKKNGPYDVKNKIPSNYLTAQFYNAHATTTSFSTKKITCIR